MPPKIIKEECNSCGICVDICPQDVYYNSKKDEIPTVTYPYECWHCNACVLDCPKGAIKLRIPLPMLMIGVE